MADIEKSLAAFLESAGGKKFINNADEVSLSGFDDLKNIGKGIHDLRSSLAQYEGAMRSLGFGKATVKEDKNGIVISFVPDSPTLRNEIGAANYPSLSLKQTKDGLILENGGGIGINTALMLSNSKGEVGVVSSISTSIAAAAHHLTEYSSKWQKQMTSKAITGKDLIKNISTTTSQSVRDIQSLDPKYYSKTQRNEYLADINKNRKLNSMAAEGLEMIKNQVRLDLLWKQLATQVSDAGLLHGKNAPKDEQALVRQLENILQESRSHTDPKEFTKIIASKYGWIYDNLWDSGLKSLYNKTVGQTSTMGVREGKPGVIGLVNRQQLADIGEIDIPNIKFIRPGGGSRKVMQNSLGVQHKALGKKSQASQGFAKLYTKSQRDNKNFQERDLYYSLELTDDIMYEIYKEDRKKYELLKKDRDRLNGAGKWKNTKEEKEFLEFEKKYQAEQRMLLAKGFGDSATLQTEAMSQDFKVDANTYDSIKGTASLKKIKAKIRDKVETRIKNKQKQEDLSPQKLNDLVEQEYQAMDAALNKQHNGSKMTPNEKKLYNWYDYQIKFELGKMLNLDKMESVSQFKIGDDQDLITDIVKKKTRNTTQGVSRGGPSFDDRSLFNEISKEFAARSAIKALVSSGYSQKQAEEMVYSNSSDPSKGLKVNIFREQEEITEKNYINKLNGLWEFILNEADRKKISRQQVLDKMEKTNLHGIQILNKQGEWEFSNKVANERFFNAIRDKSKQQYTPLDYLNELGRVGMDLGVISPSDKIKKQMTNDDLYYADTETGNIKSRMPLIYGQTRYLTSGDTYEGQGQETESGSKWNQRYVDTLEGTINNVNWKGRENERAAVEKHLQDVKDQLAERVEEYKPYYANAEYVAHTFDTDIEKRTKNLQNDPRVMHLSAKDIQDWDFSPLNYTADDFAAGVPLSDNDASKKLVELRQKIWHNDYDKWKALGLTNENDLQFVLDIGDIVSGTVDGQDLALSSVPLFADSVGGNYDVTTGILKSNDNGTFMLDENARRNRENLAKAAKYFKANSNDKADMAQALVSTIRRNQLEGIESVGKGALYHSYHEVSKKEGTAKGGIASGSGYLATGAMNKHAQQIFRDILHDKGLSAAGINSPLAVINTQTAKEAYNAQWKEHQAELRDEYQSIYGLKDFDLKNHTAGKEIKDINKLSKEKILSGLINAYNINSKDYTGKTNSQWSFLRNPIIKFSDDIVNPGVVFTDDNSVVGQGAMSIDMDLAKSIKNDMDGDRILAEFAYYAGDYNTYTKMLAKMQSDASKAEKNKKSKNTKTQAELEQDFNAKIADPQKRREAETIQNVGKKGSGIYGDLAFGTHGLLKKYGLDMASSAPSVNRRIANFATNVSGTLYQEGINIKNTKSGQNGVEDLDSDTVSDLESLMYLSKQAYTWDDAQGFLNFAKLGQKLGIFGAGDNDHPVFKANVFGNIGLSSLDYRTNAEGKATGKDNEFVDQLLTIAENAKDYYTAQKGKNSDECKKIRNDIEQIKAVQKGNTKDLSTISLELLSAIITDEQFGLKGIFNTASGGKLTVGQGMQHLYDFIDTKGSVEYGDLEAVRRQAEKGSYSQNILDSNKDLKDRVESHKKDLPKEKTEYAQILEAKLSDITTSPSQRVKGRIPSDYAGVQQDAREYLSALHILSDRGASAEEKNAAQQTLANGYRLDTNLGPSIKGMVRGNLAHKAAEIQRNYGAINIERRNKDTEQLETFIHPELQKVIGESTEQLQSILHLSNEDIDKIITDSINQGQSNAILVDKRIKELGASAIGNETTIAGLTRPDKGYVQLSNEIADLIYETIDSYGNRTWTIGDYKNTKGGPSLENALQVMEYARSLSLLNDNILDIRKKANLNGKATRAESDAYLASGETNTIADAWNKRLQSAAKTAAKNKGITEAQALEIEKENFFKNKYSRLSSNKVRMQAELYGDSGNGVKSIYNVDLTNQILKELFDRYYGNGIGSILTDDDKKAFEESRAVTNVRTEFGGTLEQLSELPEVRSQLIKYATLGQNKIQKENQIRLNQAKIKSLGLSANSSPENVERVQKLQEANKQDFIDLYGYASEDQEQYQNKTAVEIDAEISNQLKDIVQEMNSFTPSSGEELTQQQQDRLAELTLIKQQLEDKKKQIESSVDYQMADIKKVTSMQIGGVNVSDLINAGTAKLEEGLINNASKESTQDTNQKISAINREDYIVSAKKLRGLLEQSAKVQNAAKSKYISKSEKSDYKRAYESLAIQIEQLQAEIEPLYKDLTDEDKEKVSGYAEDIDTKAQKSIKQKATREAKIAEQNKTISFSNKAYNIYKKQYDIENSIWELNQKMASGSVNGDQLKILESERENLEQQLKLYQEMVPNLKNIEGYSKKSTNQAKEKAQLEADQWKLGKQKQFQNTPDMLNAKLGIKNDNDRATLGEFLGLDSTMMQWVDRMLNGGLIYAGINKIKKGISDLVNKAAQLDKVMTNLRIVTGDNGSDARVLVGQYADLAKQLGVTTTEAATAAAEWARQGYDTAEAMDLVKSSTYLSKLGMIDATTATKDLTSAMKGFKMEASESMDIVDKLTALDVKAATTAGDIAEGLSQFANLATLNGVDLDQASAYVATIADVTQQSGSSVGTALKTIMSRYSNVKATAYNELNIDSDSTTDTSNDLNDVEKVLSKLGISMRDTNLEFKDFDDVLDEIAEKWDSLDNVSKRAIANAFAGKHV